MKVLTPIDVEKYENSFKTLLSDLSEASEYLIPDAYQTEKEQLTKAYQLISAHCTGFNEVLNNCSVGVIFNESFLMPSIENNSNSKVAGLLWHCEDIISSIMLFNSDLKFYIESLNVSDPMVWKMDQLILTEKKFNVIIDDLEQASNLIMSVLTKLDGYII